MLEAISRISQYTQGLDREAFGENPQVVDAVTWNLMILGEAATHVPDDIVAGYPSVPWYQMRGIRNRIVHGYDQIDLDIIWNVVEVELPPLVPQLEQVFAETVD